MDITGAARRKEITGPRRNALSRNSRAGLLYGLGAGEADIPSLLDYTANAFSRTAPFGDAFLRDWEPIFLSAGKYGAAEAVNNYIAPKGLRIGFIKPEGVVMELFESIGGAIPVITIENTVDFENAVRNIVYKGENVTKIAHMGASFVFGKNSRFIILSKKPYANIPARIMGLGENEWGVKSLTIRKYHECAHYFTKRFMGSARNNLHDEIIADFCGFSAAFNEYKAIWFMLSMGVSNEQKTGRIKIYAENLSEQGLRVIEKLAGAAAKGLEEWSQTDEFKNMGEAERVEALCEKDILSFAQLPVV